MNTPPRIPTISGLRGLWTRSLIAWPDGRRDTTTAVRWLQGPMRYIDLRQPAGRPDFSSTRCVAEADLPALAWLASQEGFAGVLTQDGPWFEWGRDFDLQPQGMYSDCGKLWYEGDFMVEEGRDLPYIEHWHHQAVGDPNPCVALRLRAIDAPRDGFLVRVGPQFMYACGRAVPLAPLASLLDCLHAAADQTARLALFDCEIAFGLVTGDRWEIQHSSLPWREGTTLGPQLALDQQTWRTSELTPTGSFLRRQWAITTTEGALAACAPTDP